MITVKKIKLESKETHYSYTNKIQKSKETKRTNDQTKYQLKINTNKEKHNV
jgi:hypothetical protein